MMYIDDDVLTYALGFLTIDEWQDLVAMIKEETTSKDIPQFDRIPQPPF